MNAVFTKIIPMRIPREFVPSVDDSEHRGSAARRALQADVVCALENGNFENFNSPTILAKIITKVMETKTYVKHTVGTNPTFKNVARNIKTSVDSRMPVVMGTSCGINACGTQVNMWVMNNKDVYIDCVVLRDTSNKTPPVLQQNEDYTPEEEEETFIQLEDETTNLNGGLVNRSSSTLYDDAVAFNSDTFVHGKALSSPALSIDVSTCGLMLLTLFLTMLN